HRVPGHQGRLQHGEVDGPGAGRRRQARRFGARAAARVASRDGDGSAAGAAAVSGWLSPDVPPPAKGADTTTATVTVHVPAVIPLFDGWDVTRHATMPNDD
ncbi:hypothetical protein ACWDAF_29195, partial [Streptomyces sp. NPDC001226]